MALETLSSTELLNYLIHNTISPSPLDSLQPNFILCNSLSNSEDAVASAGCVEKRSRPESSTVEQNTAVQEKKKRKKRQRTSKNKEESESQRMTHIAVERNRRKMMNEHLAVLRSLMPQSFAQRGDQASIVGGAINFLKELEQNLHSLEAQKQLLLIQQDGGGGGGGATSSTHNFLSSNATTATTGAFARFISNPQYTSCRYEKAESKKEAEAEIEVTLIETHANVRILTRRRKVKQLSKFVIAFHSMFLTILHLNLTSFDPLMVLYSISAKVEEGCALSSADEIAGAINDILRNIEEEL